MKKQKNVMENKGNSCNDKGEYILSNPWLRVYLSPWGAGIHRIYWKSPDNTFKNIALALKDIADYTQNSSYAGATLAPTSGRLEHGILKLSGHHFTLDRNENEKNHLHGGSHNLSFCQWTLKELTDVTAQFTADAVDGLDGYPGNRKFEVTYKINGNQLEISQNAWSDKETYFNLSNHTYFNLNSFSESGLDQYLYIQSERAAINDISHIPWMISDIKNTPLDFRYKRIIGRQKERFSSDSQIQYARGFNHCYLLKKENSSLPDAALFSLDKKICMELYTDSPALVFYSGGFLNSDLQYRKNENDTEPLYPGCAIALEPCSVPAFNGNVQGMRTFSRQIIYKFIPNDIEP